MTAEFAETPRGGHLRQEALKQELNSLVGIVEPHSVIDVLLERSFELGATDIHLDPQVDGLHVRLRVDGLLHDILVVKPDTASNVVSRLKVMANMDITERRTAQDGQISQSLLSRRRNIRLGSGPTINGERMVLRLMPDGTGFTALDQLGFNDLQMERFLKAIDAPHGMVLTVGPVGSGKSTTNYAALSRLHNPQQSLVTIEDPVERQVPGVNQIQVDPGIGLTFPAALRGVLRQDPNVLLVGEIRDEETAQMATRAGMTGIRILSTMHAQDTGSAIDMLHEFHVPRLFVANSLTAIVAQRLLRRVCSSSREVYKPNEAEAQLLGLSPEEGQQIELARGISSDANFYTGYSGRTGVYEVMYVDDAIRHAILDGRNGAEIHQLACNQGMQTLQEAASEKVLAGITSIEEMNRVLPFS